MSAKSNSSSVSILPASSAIEPILVDIPTAARMLSTTLWAIRRLIWAKQIVPIKIGKKFLIDPADLRTYVQRQKATA
jgi:hypothetical protein